MTFKKAVETSTPPLNMAYQLGMQALGDYSKKIKCARKPNETITGSVDLDSTLARLPEFASANRWDYGLGYLPKKGKECAVWIEVHGAKDKEIGTITRKVKWLKTYLPQYAPKLWAMTLDSPDELRYVWISTNSGLSTRHTKNFRQAAQEGILMKPVSVLTLP